MAKVVSEKTRENIRKALKDRPLSKETKEKMKGRIPWNKGLKLGKQSKELIERRVKARAGYKNSKDHNRNISEARTGFKMSDDQKEKLSKAHKGKKLSEDHKNNIGKNLKGHIAWNKNKIYEEMYDIDTINRIKNKQSSIWKGKKRPKFSREWIKNIRLAHIKHIEWQFNNGLPLYPIVGKYESKILNKLEKSLGFKIIRQHKVCGFFLDGYIPEINLAIEIDEQYHKGRIKKDYKRQKEIEKEINCTFLRIPIEVKRNW